MKRAMTKCGVVLLAVLAIGCGGKGGGGIGGDGGGAAGSGGNGGSGGSGGSGGVTTVLEMEATGTPQASATVSTALDEPIGIRVFDEDGAGVGGVDVRWTVLAGEGTLSSSTTQTSADGKTGVTWTLGARAGTNEVQASVDGAEPVVFRVLGVPDAPHAVAILVGGAPTESLRLRKMFEVVPLEASVVDRHGNAVDASCEATWESSEPNVVIVLPTGEVLPFSEGQATVVGRCDGLEGTLVVIVDFTPDRRVVVSPSEVEIAVGETVQLAATVFDKDGAKLPDELVTWSSDDPTIATVDQDGLVTARRTGGILILAASGDGIGSAYLQVGQAVPTAALRLHPSTLVLTEGATTFVSATALDETGEVIEDAVVAWSSVDHRIATVDLDGLVTGVMDGSTWIEARSGDVSATVRITVIGRIAFRRDDTALHTMASDGSDILNLALHSYDLDWSPDGRRFLYRIGNSIWATGIHVPDEQLTDGFEDSSPAWSPDGSTIAFAREVNGTSKLHLMAADGSDVRMVSDPETTDIDTSPAWSPDGTMLAFESGGGRVYTMNADGTNRSEFPVSNRPSHNPVWSPDGTRLAFSEANALVAGSHIAVVDLASGELTILTDQHAYDESPTWSPDGTRIAFASSREAGDVFWQIWVMDEWGTGPMRLSDGTTRDEGPKWRPPLQP